MNLLLFEKQQEEYSIPATSTQGKHITDILKMDIYDTLFVGAANGPLGKGTITATFPEIKLAVVWEKVPPPLAPIHLIVGLPRPQTARKILQEMATLGISQITLFKADKGDPNYAQSTLWHSNEWKRLLMLGAEQACATTFPHIKHTESLEAALQTLHPTSTHIALDIYESSLSLNEAPVQNPHVTLAIGPERGWSASERNILRTNNFTLAHLGSRILRTETACVAGVSLLLFR